jgi:hypothetical protein
MPELRQRRSGCPSPTNAKQGGLLFGGFLLATQEKVTRAPRAHESSCFSELSGFEDQVSRLTSSVPFCLTSFFLNVPLNVLRPLFLFHTVY